MKQWARWRFRSASAMLASTLILGCSSSTDDDDNLFLTSLFFLSANGAAQATANTSASQAGAAAGVIGSTVAFQAGTGALTFFDLSQPGPMLARALVERRLNVEYREQQTPRVLPTALTTTTGSCNTGSCSATIDGDTNCANGGSFTLSNYAVTMTISGAGASYTSTQNGQATLNSCIVRASDFINYPSLTQVVMGGSMTVNGTQNLSFSTAGATRTIVLNSSVTTTSSDLSFNGGPATAMDVLETTALTEITTITTNTSSVSGTVTTEVFAFSTVLNGTVSRSGTIGGTTVNVSRTFNNESFELSGVCTKDSATATASCTLN